MNKAKKTKVAIITAATLAGVALIGSGFATWTIIANGSAEATGNIKTDTVSDQRVTIRNQRLSVSQFVFGWSEGETTYSWLSHGGNDFNDVLSTTLTFTVDHYNTSLDTGYPQITIAAEGLYNLISGNYITLTGWSRVGETDAYKLDTAPTGTTVEGNAYGAGSYSVEITFAWGSKFDNKNPYLYYNNLEDNMTNEDAAVADLNAIAALNDKTFTVTITTKAKTAA